MSHPTAVNRRATFDYEITETIEAGVVLVGPEVKSIRQGKVRIAESHAQIIDGEMWLLNAYIEPYLATAHVVLDPRRNRKLLVSRAQLNRWMGRVKEKGFTIVPMSLYFSHHRVKLKLGLAKSKKLYDKRAAIKDREVKRELDRARKSS